MKRNYSLFRVALFLATGCAVLLPLSAPAPTVQLTILQPYLGFSQSFRDPNVRGPAQLIVTSQVGDDWTGLLTIYGNTYSIKGKVDANGNLKFTSGRAGEINGDGKWQDLTRGGALIFGSYKLASGDQGQVNFLGNFSQPAEPEMPPNIAGSWRGTVQDVLSLTRGTDEWMVQQDRTPNGTLGTRFTGQETVDAGTPAVQLYQFAGTVDAHGNFVRIGVSAQGFLTEGGKLESGELTGQSCLDFVDGRNEIRTFRISTVPF
jgi:hypothetical protein